MRKLVKFALGILIVLVLLLAVVWLSIDYIAKAGIEAGGTYAFGVKTTVNSVSLGILSGQAKVNDLAIANPEGFKTPHLMKTGRIEVGVNTGSILGDTVQVDKFEIDGLDLNLEVNVGSTNISALLDNINKAAGGRKPQETKDSGGRKVKVGQVRISNVVAHVRALPIGGNATTLELKIPEIVLKNVTEDNAGGVAVPELMRRLVPAILAAVIEKGKGVIPDADLKRLGNDVAATAQALGAGAGRLVQQMGGDAGKAIEGLGTGIQKIGEPATKGVGDALKGIFGDKKADAPKK